MTTKRRRVLRPSLDRLDDRCLLSTTPAGLSPAQVAQAYGLNNLTSANGTALTGAGQTIVLIEAYTNPNLAQEVAGFDKQFNLTNLTVSSTIGGSSGPTLTQHNMGSSSNVNAGWAEEEALDVEWAHAIAPGANILVVEASSPTTPALMAAVVYAEQQKGVTVVSMSWGESEVKSDEATYDKDFNVPGIAFVASSGDSGPTAGTEWPAASPNVVGVGGTSLKISTSGSTTTYVSESAWDNAYGGSQGGQSAYEAEPSYQDGVQSTGKRSTPDVAFDADPTSGVAVYYIAPTTKNATTTSGSWMVVGGTSLGAPAWAAIIALADEDLILSKLASLSSNQVLTDFFDLAAVSPGDFHTVTPTTVTTGGGLSFGGRFSGAQSSIDDDTGLGSPNGSSFFTGLIDEAKGVAPPKNPGTEPSTFNGQSVPTTTGSKSTGTATGTTTGGGTTGGQQGGGQQGGGQGGQGGQQGGAGWWWWFGWSPFDAIDGPAVGSTGGSGSGHGLASSEPASGSTNLAPSAPTYYIPSSADSLGTSSVGSGLGLMATAAPTTPATLLPLQNVPDLGAVFDEALDLFDWHRFSPV